MNEEQLMIGDWNYVQTIKTRNQKKTTQQETGISFKVILWFHDQKENGANTEGGLRPWKAQSVEHRQVKRTRHILKQVSTESRAALGSMLYTSLSIHALASYTKVWFFHFDGVKQLSARNRVKANQGRKIKRQQQRKRRQECRVTWLLTNADLKLLQLGSISDTGGTIPSTSLVFLSHYKT